jgi:hypothetical protein
MMKSRRMRRAGHVACMGTKINEYRVLVGKPETTTETYTRWQDNNKMDRREMDKSTSG